MSQKQPRFAGSSTSQALTAELFKSPFYFRTPDYFQIFRKLNEL